MQDVSTGEDALDAGLERLAHLGSLRHGAELDACLARQLVLGQKAHGEQ